MPHTADLRIEAWAPTRDDCIKQAVLGAVESFLDISDAGPTHTRVSRLTAASDDDLLVAVLDEAIYLLDTEGEVPVDLTLRDTGDSVEVAFEMVDAGALPQVGAVPKAVALNDLRLSHDGKQWRCLVTLDV
ncbi:archease [Mycolicibacterium agri]|uniref:Archease n=1 Tax=Mycolicibacterium agri TaxID=36811 RepID=A0A2A7MPM6_MYCAG|nr:archease [Mycolicibacterium agri]